MLNVMDRLHVIHPPLGLTTPELGPQSLFLILLLFMRRLHVPASLTVKRGVKTSLGCAIQNTTREDFQARI
jgi:hypothetical protein